MVRSAKWVNGVWLLVSFLFVNPDSSAQSRSITITPVVSEDLSNAFVRCILKDSRGFMWFGTENGLIRYDGTTTVKYEHNPDDTTSLLHSSINAIVEDEHHHIWIGTAEGLNVYVPERDRFFDFDEQPSNKNHLNNGYVTSLCFDHSGKLWIGTHGGGINVFDFRTNTFTYLYVGPGAKPLSAISYINDFLEVDNLMWVGTKGGLALFNVNDLATVSNKIAGENLSGKQITQLAQAGDGNIWLSTFGGDIIEIVKKNGAYYADEKLRGQNIYGPNWNSILTLCPDDKNNLWIAGDKSGLNYFDTKKNQVIRYLVGQDDIKDLPTNSIRSVYIDDRGVTWIGTYNKGVCLIDSHAKKFDSYQHGGLFKPGVSGNEVKGIAEDKHGNIWIAYDGEGLSLMDAGTQQVRRCDGINGRLANKYITSIIFDSDENLWVGTVGKGVYKINPRNNNVENFSVRSTGFGDDKISCLYQDAKGNVWAGTSGSGIFYLKKGANTFSLLCEQDKPDFITKTAYVSAVLEDFDGNLWVSTLYGLYRLKTRDDFSFDYSLYLRTDQPGSINSNRILAIALDNQGNLLFGTIDNGLNILKRNTSSFIAFQKKDNLLSNTIRGLVPDSANVVWVSSDRGLSKFNYATASCKNFRKENGLISNEFLLNSCCRSSNGKIYFGTDKGLISFFPDSIRDSSTRPIVYLTDLRINNQSVKIGEAGSPLSKPIGFTNAFELAYDQRSFVIDFVAVSYGQSAQNQYCYKLEGFDDDWNCLGSNHTATYTNVDPGNYRFLVKASNADGVWSEMPATVSITIRQAPWKTWWALTVYLSIVAAIISFLVRIRIERLKMRNQLAFEKLAREKEHELSESKAQFFTNISHELRTPLSLILMPLESSLATDQVPPSIRTRLTAAYKSAGRMMRLVNELMDFNKLEDGSLKLKVQQGELVGFISDIASAFEEVAVKRRITYTTERAVTSLTGWFDRYKIEMILLNILSNAFKFTPDGGEIKLVIDSYKGNPGTGKRISCRCLELTIIDNGAGISEEELPRIFDKFYQASSASVAPNPGTGIGLSLTKGLVELHHGSITAESKKGETIFRVVLPIDRDSYADEELSNLPVSVTIAEDENTFEASIGASEPKESNDTATILVVEDNEELRKYLSDELRREYEVLEAKDGIEGFEIASDKTVDVIVSDILMPRQNGIDLCRSIKSNLKTSHIPFILLTAKATLDDQITGIETGADIYVTKPFSIRFLMAHVRQIIASRRKLYSLFSNDVYLLPGKIANNEIDKTFLQKAIDYITENIQDPQLGVDSIANLFNLSRVQVYRKIKALTGNTVVEFIRTVRIKQALKLMETRKYTLSEIAHLTGFNSASYFTKSFKDHFGKAPSEYLEKT